MAHKINREGSDRARPGPWHLNLHLADVHDHLEATSGALPARDEWYREKMPMTDLAIQNGLYLRAVTKSETVALMASTLLEKYAGDKRFEDRVRLADVILEFFPRDLHALVWKGSAYGGITERERVGSEAVRSS